MRPPPQSMAAPGAPTPINTVMTHVLEQLQQAQQHAVNAELWRQVVGPALAVHSAPTACHGGRLTVRVDRPGPLFLLHLKRRDVLQRLEERMGRRIIEELCLQLGQHP